MAAEPVSARRNWRSGVFPLDSHSVRLAVAGAVVAVAGAVGIAELARWGSVLSLLSRSRIRLTDR
jgi:hypothetical protein